jgi:hypothetical protein
MIYFSPATQSNLVLISQKSRPYINQLKVTPVPHSDKGIIDFVVMKKAPLTGLFCG